jgi:hypothetical protein
MVFRRQFLPSSTGQLHNACKVRCAYRRRVDQNNVVVKIKENRRYGESRKIVALKRNHISRVKVNKVKCTLVQALRLCTGCTVKCTLVQAMRFFSGRTVKCTVVQALRYCTGRKVQCTVVQAMRLCTSRTVKCTVVQALRLCTGRTVKCTVVQALRLCTGRSA